MNERQYFEQFSGEPMALIGGGGNTELILPMNASGSFICCPQPTIQGDRVVIQSNMHPSATWPFNKPPFVDDEGNPPPPFLMGDMIATWYKGRWFACHEEYVKAQKEHEGGKHES